MKKYGWLLVAALAAPALVAGCEPPRGAGVEDRSDEYEDQRDPLDERSGGVESADDTMNDRDPGGF